MNTIKRTMLYVLSTLMLFCTVLGVIFGLDSVVLAAEVTNDKMLHYAPSNGNYSFGAQLEGKGAEGMCMEFDLYDTNFRETADGSKTVAFKYAKSNLQFFDISGNNLQNLVKFSNNNTFTIVCNDGNSVAHNALTVEGDASLFMVEGYRYRVEVRGGEATSLPNYFVASRRPISDENGEYERIVWFELPSYVADRGQVNSTYAGMGAIPGVTVALDNIYVGRTADAASNCVTQNFDGEGLVFDKGVEIHDRDGYSGIDVYNPGWQAFVGGYGELKFFYWVDNSNVSANDTEYNLTDAPEKNVVVTFMHNNEEFKKIVTYSGGVVKAPSAPAGYKWNLEDIDLTNVSESVTVESIESSDPQEASGNKVFDWNVSAGNVPNAIGALLDGSTGSCVEFDLYDTNFWDLDDGSIDGLSAAERMYKPYVAFAYGRMGLRFLDIFGNNMQNIIQFFPNGEFNDVTHDGNPVAINPEMIDGDPELFMQPGYSYRVEMRTGTASELPNSFVVSRKEIVAPAEYYEKILSFDLIAPQMPRGEAAQTYAGMETRSVRLVLDNIAVSREAGADVVKRADCNDGAFDPGVACSTLPAYAAGGAPLLADGYEGKLGELGVFYWGNQWLDSTERTFSDRPFVHTLTFKVEGEEDVVVKVYDGAKFSGPKEAGVEYVWDTDAAGIDLNNITKSATITGTKTIAQCTVTFIPGRGTGSMDPVTVDYGTQITLNGNGFTRVGYTLSGWAVSATGEKMYAANEQITVTTDMTLYALWSKKVYTVTFKDGDNVLAEISVEHGAYAEYPNAAPEKEGYTFKGWDIDIDDTQIVDNVTVTAIFEKIDNGSGCNSNINIVGGAATILSFAAAAAVLLKRRNS